MILMKKLLVDQEKLIDQDIMPWLAAAVLDWLTCDFDNTQLASLLLFSINGNRTYFRRYISSVYDK